MGYMDEEDDNIEDLVMSARVFVMSISHLLEEKQGLIVELPFQKEYPDEAFGKFMISKEDEEIIITKIFDNLNVNKGDILIINEED
jgi:hypothetical protein